MKYSRCRFLLANMFIATTFNVGLTIANAAWAVGDVAIVSLRTDCTGISDCFSTITDLNNWLSSTRQPSTLKRTLVNIGSGSFGNLGLTCSGGTTGYVSFKGAGRDVTTFSTISFSNCTSISVQDLQVASTTNSVSWTGGGGSNWTNVGISSTGGKAWYGVAGSGGCARHNFFSVTLSVIAFPQGTGIYNGCGSMWLWGSEVSVSAFNYSSGSLTGILVTGVGNEAHLYGSNVRITSTIDAGAVTNPTGLVTQAGGVIHFHGGEVVVRYSNTAVNVNVVGASAEGTGSLIHTIETSYGLGPTGSGTATRVVATNSGSIQSVFQWPAGANPPMGGNSSHLISILGQDSFIENDCPLSSGTSTPSCSANPDPVNDKYPHLMVFAREKCTGTSPSTGPWFDTVTNKCRGT